MSNSEVLETLQDRIKTERKKKRVPARDAVMLDVMEFMVIYMQDDHTKVQTMWSVFKPMAWAMSAFIVSVIGLIASGRVEVFIK